MFRLAVLSALLNTVLGFLAAQTADLVVLHGNIVTMEDRQPSAQALAIRGGRIVAIGSDADLAPWAGSAAKVIDLAGKTVIPGLIDTHSHAFAWGVTAALGNLDLNYPLFTRIGQIVDAVAARARELPPGATISGEHWDDAKLAERRYLRRQDLDPVSGDHPVLLGHVSGHYLAANTVALRLAGITAHTPEPQGGVIEKDSSGEPTGVLKDAAMGLVTALRPLPSAETNLKAVDLLSRAAAEVGLTTIHNVSLSPQGMNAYQEARRRGLLKVRILMCPWVASPADLPAIRAMGVHTGFGDDQLKLGAVKMMADGGMGAKTVAIYEPPVANEPGNTGLLLWKTDELQKAQQEIASLGWQIVTHAIGDRAIDQVLDSYARIFAAQAGLDRRFRIAHCGIATPAIQKRLKQLNVIADSNPPFPYWIGSWFEKYGPERVRWSYPAKSYFDNGITVTGGADFPVSPLSPWWGVWSAVVRQELNTGRILAPEERVTVEQAIAIYTRNGAYAGFEENDKGSLRAGKLADFLVLDRDILHVPPIELKDTRVLSTFVGGIAIFSHE